MPTPSATDPTGSLPLPTTWLQQPQWQALACQHTAAASTLTQGHRDRRAAGTKHPVEDFLWVYYSYSPHQLHTWHPGANVALLHPVSGYGQFDPETSDHYHHIGSPHGPAVAVNMNVLGPRLAQRAHHTAQILAATAQKPPQLACFGMHEWAMVYQSATDRRHTAWPLRFSPAQVDQVLDSLGVRCTHFDAFRFFTPPARPLNPIQLTRASQSRHEQPGCLHAGMDLYRMAYRLSPIVGSDLVLDCFRHARRARTIDMRASPYDLSNLGYPPIRVETPTGRQEYVGHQKALATAAATLRARLLSHIHWAWPETNPAQKRVLPH